MYILAELNVNVLSHEEESQHALRGVNFGGAC